MTTDTEFFYEGRDLEALSDMPRYYQWITAHFSPYLRGDVVEIGAGIGTISKLLLPAVASLDLVEPSANLVGRLNDTFNAEPRIRIFGASLTDCVRGQPTGSRDAVIMVNVLEHIEDDIDALRSIVSLLRPGASALVRPRDAVSLQRSRPASRALPALHASAIEGRSIGDRIRCGEDSIFRSSGHDPLVVGQHQGRRNLHQPEARETLRHYWRAADARHRIDRPAARWHESPAGRTASNMRGDISWQGLTAVTIGLIDLAPSDTEMINQDAFDVLAEQSSFLYSLLRWVKKTYNLGIVFCDLFGVCAARIRRQSNDHARFTSRVWHQLSLPLVSYQPYVLM